MHVKCELLTGLHYSRSIAAICSQGSLFKHILGNSEVTVENSPRSRTCVYASDEGGGIKKTRNHQRTSGIIHVILSLGGTGGGGRIHNFVCIVKDFKVNEENRSPGRWLFQRVVQRTHHDTLPSTYHSERSWVEGSGTWALNCTAWQTLPDHLPSAP